MIAKRIAWVGKGNQIVAALSAAAMRASLLLAIAVASLSALPSAGEAASGVGRVTPSGQVTRYDVGDARSLDLISIGAGGDGNVWVAAEAVNQYDSRARFLRITSGGGVASFPAGLVPNQSLVSLTAGADGNVWFTTYLQDATKPSGAGLGQITPTGKVTFFTTPPYLYNSGDITAGPDSNLWMTDSRGYNIARADLTGRVTGQYYLSSENASPSYITAGPDGNLWFTAAGRIGRVTTSGVLTEFPSPENEVAPGIASGPDGRLWFLHSGWLKEGQDPRELQVLFRMTTAGTIDQVPIGMLAYDIVRGADGNIYVAGSRRYGSQDIGAIARVSASGQVTQLALPPCSLPDRLALGGDGNVWFTDRQMGCPPRGLRVLNGNATVDRKRRAKIPLGCIGGRPDVPCTGTIRLQRLTYIPKNGVRRRARVRTMTYASRRFSIPGAKATMVTLKLRRLPFRILSKAKRRTLYVQATVRSGTAESKRTVILTGTRPTRRRKAR